MVGVNVDVRPIAQIERWNGDGRGVVVVVIATGRIRGGISDEDVARAGDRAVSLDYCGVGGAAALGVIGGTGARGFHESRSNIRDKAGQRPRGSGDVKHGLVL